MDTTLRASNSVRELRSRYQDRIYCSRNQKRSEFRAYHNRSHSAPPPKKIELRRLQFRTWQIASSGQAT